MKNTGGKLPSSYRRFLKPARLTSLLVFLLSGTLLSAQTLDGRIKNAVDSLAQRSRVEVVIYPPVIQGTGTPSALSQYLYQKIGTYTVINNRFSVVQPARGGPPRGRIEGSYIQAGDKITVTLTLISDRNIAVAAGEFDITLDELERLNMAWLPDNIKTQEEVLRQEEIFEPVPDVSSETAGPAPIRDLAVDVWSNSETRTYYDGEKLEIQVWANRDCYFKVYHIDINNQIQLIFPNTLDSPGSLPINRDNFLPANTELTIPRGTINFVLHEPFGQETILMCAAIEQFPDIEGEMRSSGARAARETVAILSRGGSLVNTGRNISSTAANPAVPSAPASVNARFTFTILASSMAEETFSYKKPVDMAGALETLRRELAGLGGSLSGNEREGSFRSPGLEGSYRVSGDDVLFILRQQRSAQPSVTRGVHRDYNFSFDRPRDLGGALSSVRRGIAAKGGSFSGDEWEGSFQAGGIAGEYQVAEQVKVTIVEKPFIIPNSLIEREVKNFFGVP